MRGTDVAAEPELPLTDAHGDRLLSIEEVAEALGYKDTSGVRCLVWRGELPVAGRGARRPAFFKESEVLALVRKRG